MTTVQLTEDNERFVSTSLAEGLYSSQDELFNDALHSLQQEREWRRHAEEGARQLQNGEYTEFDDESLTAYFEDVKRRGRERLAAKKSAP
jgi:Arc/MetJ-type ribon-helix-helix transcriptional regulator